MNSYNGYPNYPTWNVNLWLSNDEGSYHAVQDLVRQAIEDNTNQEDVFDEDSPAVLDRDTAIYELSGALEDWCTELLPDFTGFVADIFGWAFQSVDWRHLAENEITNYQDD